MIKSDHFHYFSIKSLCCGYLLELPCRGDSNRYPYLILVRTDLSPTLRTPEDIFSHDAANLICMFSLLQTVCAFLNN